MQMQLFYNKMAATSPLFNSMMNHRNSIQQLVTNLCVQMAVLFTLHQSGLTRLTTSIMSPLILMIQTLTTHSFTTYLGISLIQPLYTRSTSKMVVFLYRILMEHGTSFRSSILNSK